MKSVDWSCPLCGQFPPIKPEIRVAEPTGVIRLYPRAGNRPLRRERWRWVYLLILAACLIGLLARCKPAERPPPPSLTPQLLELDRAQRLLDDHRVLIAFMLGHQTPALRPQKARRVR